MKSPRNHVSSSDQDIEPDGAKREATKAAEKLKERIRGFSSGPRTKLTQQDEKCLMDMIDNIMDRLNPVAPSAKDMPLKNLSHVLVGMDNILEMSNACKDSPSKPAKVCDQLSDLFRSMRRIIGFFGGTSAESLFDLACGVMKISALGFGVSLDEDDKTLREIERCLTEHFHELYRSKAAGELQGFRTDSAQLQAILRVSVLSPTKTTLGKQDYLILQAAKERGNSLLGELWSVIGKKISTTDPSTARQVAVLIYCYCLIGQCRRLHLLMLLAIYSLHDSQYASMLGELETQLESDSVARLSALAGLPSEKNGCVYAQLHLPTPSQKWQVVTEFYESCGGKGLLQGETVAIKSVHFHTGYLSGPHEGLSFVEKVKAVNTVDGQGVWLLFRKDDALSRPRILSSYEASFFSLNKPGFLAGNYSSKQPLKAYVAYRTGTSVSNWQVSGASDGKVKLRNSLSILFHPGALGANAYVTEAAQNESRKRKNSVSKAGHNVADALLLSSVVTGPAGPLSAAAVLFAIPEDMSYKSGADLFEVEHV